MSPENNDRNSGRRQGGFKKFDRPRFGNNDRRREFGNREGGDGGNRENGGREGGNREFSGRREFGSRGGGKSFGDRKFGRDGGFKKRDFRGGARRDDRRGGFNRDRNRDRDNRPAPEPTPPWMKRLLALSTEKGREKENRFLAEGVHCVEEVLQHHKDIIVEFYHLDSLAEEPIVEKMKASGKPVHPLTSEQMDQVSSTITSQGVFAVCFSEALRPDWDKCKLVTLVDAVQDPGNLGALFRTSVGFGMDAMVLGKGTVNAFNPKVVRGSSGTFLRVPFESRVELAERIQFLRGKGFSIVATSLHTPHTLETMPRLKKKVAILVGNEGAGADSKFVDLADAIIRIPMSGELESLNVAVAHGILSYQLASQK